MTKPEKDNLNIILIPGLIVIVILSLLLAYEYNKPGHAEAQTCAAYPSSAAVSSGNYTNNNGGGNKTIWMGSLVQFGNRRRLCFLAHVKVHSVDTGGEWVGCEIRLNGGNVWELESFSSSNAAAHCTASCLSF